MQILGLPPSLANPAEVSGEVVSKVVQDLTVYLVGPSEQEFEYLVNLYTKICPSDRQIRYKIAELPFWPFIARPMLTKSGREAEAAKIPYPYFEPERRRIREGRGFEAQFWDGRDINDPDGCWNLNFQRIHIRNKGFFTFARFVVPLSADCDLLRQAALAIADHVEFYSGHGGLAFMYDKWLLEDAFDSIYARARRFWGVDVEYMNGTLFLMREAIKGVNWITMLGPKLETEDSAAQIETALAQIATIPDVSTDRRKQGTVLTLGDHPVPGDQHRPDHSLDPYYNVSAALKPLILEEHPDFPGERFAKNGNTLGWIRRFINPNGWR